MRLQTGIIMGRKSNKHIFDEYQPIIDKLMLHMISIREERGISRNLMASILEMDPAALDRLEKNRQKVTFEFFLKYCDELEINPALTFANAITIKK